MTLRQSADGGLPSGHEGAGAVTGSQAQPTVVPPVQEPRPFEPGSTYPLQP